jgi:hypothetical protein
MFLQVQEIKESESTAAAGKADNVGALDTGGNFTGSSEERLKGGSLQSGKSD